MDEENEGKSDAEYLSSGIKAAGAITLGIAASAATGFGATVIISAVGALLPVAADMLARGLSLNENRRVSGVQRLAKEAFEFKIAAGERLRTDGFFNSETGVRSSADEIFEGVLQVARSEHEETKLPYVALL